MHFLVPREPLLPFFTRFVGKELDREGSFAMLIGQIGFKPVAKFLLRKISSSSLNLKSMLAN
jgi:hypothetical protein